MMPRDEAGKPVRRWLRFRLRSLLLVALLLSVALAWQTHRGQFITFAMLAPDKPPGKVRDRSIAPALALAIDGKRVRLTGYMNGSFEQTGITKFVMRGEYFIPDDGPSMPIWEWVAVEMKPGRSVDFTVSAVEVEGEFSIREWRDDQGEVLVIYSIAADSVTPQTLKR